MLLSPEAKASPDQPPDEREAVFRPAFNASLAHHAPEPSAGKDTSGTLFGDSPTGEASWLWEKVKARNRPK